jgi:hypothetical protein
MNMLVESAAAIDLANCNMGCPVVSEALDAHWLLGNLLHRVHLDALRQRTRGLVAPLMVLSA